ncbi:MAG: tetratricopeptide repeat protein [Thermoplasmata archaeon]
MRGPELEREVPSALSCPGCGAILAPGTARCPACGMSLGVAFQPMGAGRPGDSGEEFEDEEPERPAAPVPRCPRCDAPVGLKDVRCARCGFELRFPGEARTPPPPSAAQKLLASLPLAPPPTREPASPPPAPLTPPPATPPPAPPGERVPPAPIPPAGPAPRPPPPPVPAPPPQTLARPAPAPPPAKTVPVVPPVPRPPDEKRAARERFMVLGSEILIGLGIADVVVWAVPQLWTDFYINLGMCLANLVIILYVLGRAQAHYSAGSSEMSDYERKRVDRTLIGLFIFLLVPIHEVLNIFPLGYYSPSWTTYGPAGLINPMIMLIGLMVVAWGIQGSRERMGYFGIWRNGTIILVLPPIFALVQLFAPVLIAPEWFHQTVGLTGGAVMGIAFLVKSQRNKQFEELERALSWGDAYAARGQLNEALQQYDAAINVAHTLFSHLIYNPDNPYAQVRVPPAYSEPWFRKGRLLARLGDYRSRKKALAIFDMILEMDPANLTALLTEAEILTDMGEFDAAVRACNRALAIAPGHPDAMRLKAEAIRAARRAEEERERARGAESVFDGIEPSVPASGRRTGAGGG